MLLMAGDVWSFEIPGFSWKSFESSGCKSSVPHVLLLNSKHLALLARADNCSQREKGRVPKAHVCAYRGHRGQHKFLKQQPDLPHGK